MRALLLIDIQNDFIPGGALPARNGGEVVPVANRLLDGDFDLIVASLDWHPADHLSFASQHPGRNPGDHVDLNGIDQVLWPDHCVQNSLGANLHADLNRERLNHLVYKGTDRKVDSYSAFFDNARLRATGLGDFLHEKEVNEIFVAGLATDYCVKYSVLDAIDLGFDVRVVEDGCRGVELVEGDVASAIDEMRRAGAKIMTSDQVIE